MSLTFVYIGLTPKVKAIMRVDIVKVKNPAGWTPNPHHAVEEEKTDRLLFECDTQQEAIDWARKNGHTVNVHRERNRKPSDRHGRYRAP